MAPDSRLIGLDGGSKPPRKPWLTLAVVVCVLPGYSVQVMSAHDPTGQIRIDNNRVFEVYRYALKGSPSFGDLIAAIELLDGVVYIDEGHCRQRYHRGCLQLMPTPGAKRILIYVDPRQPIRVVAAELAHELYHALEIAREPDVIDDVSLRTLYGRIGERSCHVSGDCWDTRAARRFEALVRSELAAAKRAHRPPSVFD